MSVTTLNYETKSFLTSTRATANRISCDSFRAQEHSSAITPNKTSLSFMECLKMWRQQLKSERHDKPTSVIRISANMNRTSAILSVPACTRAQWRKTTLTLIIESLGIAQQGQSYIRNDYVQRGTLQQPSLRKGQHTSSRPRASALAPYSHLHTEWQSRNDFKLRNKSIFTSTGRSES